MYQVIGTSSWFALLLILASSLMSNKVVPIKEGIGLWLTGLFLFLVMLHMSYLHIRSIQERVKK